METFTFNTMSNSWVKVNGVWKEAVNVWIKAGGIWRANVIPKGYVLGELKSFKTYGSDLPPAGENPTLPSLPPTIVDDFTGSSIAFPHEMGRDYPWIWDKGTSPTGDIGFIRTSNPSISRSSSIITFFVDVPDIADEMEALLEVDCAVSSESSYDKLVVYHASTPVDSLTSTSDGNLVKKTIRIPLIEGRNPVKFSYDKDNSADRGTDSAYIDKMTLLYQERGSRLTFLITDDFTSSTRPYTWGGTASHTWKVSSGKFVNDSFFAMDGYPFYFLNVPHSDGVFYEIDYSTNKDAIVCYRVSDVNSGFFISGDSLYLKTDKSVATQLGTLHYPMGSSGRLRIELAGGEHKIFINGALSLTYNSLVNATATGFGVGANQMFVSPTTQFDNLRVGSL